MITGIQPNTTMPIGPRVRTYIALLTQTGTNAPVATILQNTLEGIPIWTRDIAGFYIATLTGKFPEQKLTITFGNTYGAGVEYAADSNTPPDSIYISSSTAGTPADDLLDNSPIIISVYQ